MAASIDVELLDTDNYAVWSQKMQFLLTIKDLWGAISGDKVKEGVDAKARALIGLHVKDYHLSTLARSETAREAWEAFAGIYQAKSNAKRLQLKKQLNSLEKAHNEPLTAYIARATDLLTSCCLPDTKSTMTKSF